MDKGIMDTIKEVDHTFFFIFSIAALLFLLISLSMILILIRYHYKRHPQAASFKDNVFAEVIWVIAPALIVLAMFVSGWKSYLALRSPPKDAMEVEVTARKWSWSFTYENRRISNILYVPVNRSIFLKITSLDVLHSFYAPAFRIKRDAVPGMTTSLWFRSKNTGSFNAMCAEYCGLGHSQMRTKIIVLTQEEFNLWYEGGKEPEGVELQGRELFMTYGCIGCHPMGNLEGIGPPLEKLFGKKQTVDTKAGEQSVVVDDQYIIESILHPNDMIVKGYPPIMPSFEGKIPDEDLDALVRFIRTLSGDNGYVKPALTQGAQARDMGHDK